MQALGQDLAAEKEDISAYVKRQCEFHNMSVPAKFSNKQEFGSAWNQWTSDFQAAEQTKNASYEKAIRKKLLDGRGGQQSDLYFYILMRCDEIIEQARPAQQAVQPQRRMYPYLTQAEPVNPEKTALLEKLIAARADKSTARVNAYARNKIWDRERELKAEAQRLGISGFDDTVFEKAAELEYLKEEKKFEMQTRQRVQLESERIQQESERTSRVALSALERYKKRELTYSEITSSWISGVLDYTSDMQSGSDKQEKDRDFFVLRAIATLLKPGRFNGCLEIKNPTDAKVARWLSEQERLLKVIGVAVEDDFQFIIASRGQNLRDFSFEQLRLPCETLVASLDVNKCGAIVKYNCTTNAFDVYFKPGSAFTLNIYASEITRICKEAPEAIQTLLDRFSSHADFDVVFTARTFNPPIAWNNPRLKRVVVETSKLSYEHVESLKQALSKGLTVTLRDCMAWPQEKEQEIQFMLCALLAAHPTERVVFETQKFRDARGDYNSRSNQLSTLVSLMESSDLRFEDLKDEKLWAVILATARLGISPLCGREAFQYLSAIASVLLNPSQVTIKNQFDLYAVEWVLAQTGRHITVNGLADPNHFAVIQGFLAQAPAKRKNITFKSIACAPEVFLPFVQGDNVAVSYAKETDLTIGHCAILPVANNPSCSIFSVGSACDVAQWNSMLTLMQANPSTVRLYFNQGSFRAEFSLVCSKITHLSFSEQTFTAADLDTLEKIPEGQLRTMSLYEHCVIPERLLKRFFEFVRSRQIIWETCPERIMVQYRGYLKEQEAIQLKQDEENKRNNVVRELIQKYKEGTLEYDDLLNRESVRMVFDVFRSENKSADIDAVTLEHFKCIIAEAEHRTKNEVRLGVDDPFVQVASWFCQKQKGDPCIIVQGDLNRPESLARLNQLTSTLTRPFTLVFDKKQCVFVAGVNLSNPNLVGLELRGQPLSAESVATLRQATQLRSVVVSDCTFGTTIAEADANRTGCVEAVLRNQQLTNITLTNCGLGKKHLDLISGYLATHAGLRVVNVENNAFRQYEDAEYKSWLDFYKALRDLEELPLDYKVFKKIVNMINAAFDSESGQSNPMWNVEARLMPFYVCARKIDCADSALFFKHFDELNKLLRHREFLSHEQVVLVLQSVVDNALVAKECAREVALGLPALVRENNLNDEGVCTLLMQNVRASLHAFQVMHETQSLRDETSIQDALRIFREAEDYLGQLRLHKQSTEIYEVDLCRHVTKLADFYISCKKQWFCERSILRLLVDVINRNKSFALAAEPRIVAMQCQQILRNFNVHVKKYSEPQAQFIKELSQQTTLEGLIELLRKNVKLIPGKMSKEIDSIINFPLYAQLIEKLMAVRNSPVEQRKEEVYGTVYPRVAASGAIIPAAVAPAPGAPPLVHLKEDDVQRMYDQFGGSNKQPPVAEPENPAPSAPPAPVSNENTVNAAPQYQPQPAGFVALPDAYNVAPAPVAYGAQPVREGQLAANVRGYGASPLQAAVPRGVAPAPAPVAPDFVLPDVPRHPIKRPALKKRAEEAAE